MINGQLITDKVPSQPKTGMSKAEKFADKGKYFRDYAQYIVYNYYNTYRVPSSVPGMPTRTIVGEQLDSLKYLYGYQDTRTFNYMTKTFGGGDIPAIWINGQNIRTFFEHIKGNIRQTLKPLNKSTHCESISDHAVRNKKDAFFKLENAAALNKLLEGTGAKFTPFGDTDYSDSENIDKIREKIRSEFEYAGTLTARSIIYRNGLEQDFEDDGVYALQGNLSAAYMYEHNGCIKHEVIPNWNCIFDYSSAGCYGEGQTFGGFVVPITMEEACEAVKRATGDNYCSLSQLNELQNIASGVMPNPYNSYEEFCDAANAPFQNVKWWYNDKKYVSRAVVFWLDTEAIPYTQKKGADGVVRTRILKPEKKYSHNGGEAYGYEIEGDKKTWYVHYCELIGNKYAVRYGYEPYQVRGYDKDKPQIPMFYFCPSKIGGYMRSFVSRLKQNQDELDRLAFKIQELTANDLGTVFFFKGAKGVEGTTPYKIIDELKSFRITVITPTGEENENGSLRDYVEKFDMSNNQYILSYIELRKEQIREMENITSIPAPALGLQQRVIGKGVQENTIAQSSLGMLSFYEGIQEYWRKKIQYMANKQKLVWASKPDEYIIPISNQQLEIFNVTKEFRFEDLFVYFEADDSINANDKALLDQLLLAYAQNSQNPLAAAQAILNGMSIMKSKTYGESIHHLKKHVEELKGEAEKAMQQQQLMDMKNKQFEALTYQQTLLQQQMGEIYKILLKENLSGAWAVKNTEVKAGANAAEDEVVITDALQQQAKTNPVKEQQRAEQPTATQPKATQPTAE